MPKPPAYRLIQGADGAPQSALLRILLVEDVPTDAELVGREVRRGGIDCEIRRVDTVEGFRRELVKFSPAVILSDFAMPSFDGMQALAISRQIRPEVPFIFVSGVMGEEYAVRALKDGATDYVLKNNLLRLPAAVRRALDEARDKAAVAALQSQLAENEKRYRELFEGNPHPMWVYDPGTLQFLTVNPAAIARYGYSREEFLAMKITDI